jgi:hypothetical protein
VLELSHDSFSPAGAAQRRFSIAVLTALAAMGASSLAHAQGNFGGSAWGDAQGFLDEDDPKDDYVQPPVTSGGLFTKESYPVSEIDRPLTITKGIGELRAAIDFDLSANRAFEVFFSRLQGRYGLRDHIELQASFDGLLGGEISSADVAAGHHQAAMSFGLETAIAYDVVNVRATAEIPLMPERTFDLALGVPVRYRATSQVAIIAADRLLTIHTDGRKPDLTAGIGGLFQISPEFAAIARAEITILQFNTDLDPIIPVIAAVQYSPTHLVDLGLQLSFANLGAKDARFDSRYALLFGRLRL